MISATTQGCLRGLSKKAKVRVRVTTRIICTMIMSMPIAHVEESWQMAEFYSNKVSLGIYVLDVYDVG